MKLKTVTVQYEYNYCKTEQILKILSQFVFLPSYFLTPVTFFILLISGIWYIFIWKGTPQYPVFRLVITLIKKETKFSSYMRKFKWDLCKVIYEEGLPNIWGNAQIFHHIHMRRPLVIYDLAWHPIPLNFLILYMRKILFSFISV